MAKLKWKYDKKFKQWWIGESVPYANDGAQIGKEKDGRFLLRMDYPHATLRFGKLKDAKDCAQLIHNG